MSAGSWSGDVATCAAAANVLQTAINVINLRIEKWIIQN
jgi:hypothetical protein